MGTYLMGDTVQTTILHRSQLWSRVYFTSNSATVSSPSYFLGPAKLGQGSCSWPERGLHRVHGVSGEGLGCLGDAELGTSTQGEGA